VLKELKQRCRGYQGQFYELVKPINPKYDIAIKVALKKCLKMLVVDSAEAAQTCSDFLKEKQLSLEVLVLSNVPQRHFTQGLTSKLNGVKGAIHMYEVIEVPRSEVLLEQAVRYFVGDKVFASDFAGATQLQQRGVHEIICADGTCFNRGMISGGTQQNIFKIQLGTSQIDK
jgi:chromosome segregation ATPase